MLTNNKLLISLFVFLATTVPAFAGDIMTEVLIEGAFVFLGYSLLGIGGLLLMGFVCTFMFKAFGYIAMVAFIIFLQVFVILCAL